MKKKIPNLILAFASFSALLFTGCDKEDPDAIKMDDVNKGIQIVIGSDGKEYQVVNLGLNSHNLWATCNMGATSPEQTGSLYAWGEMTPKKEYSWTNYRWSKGNDLDITKYYTEDSGNYSIIGDQKTKLDISDVVPDSIMGKGWRIPSVSDFREILTNRNCTAKWCKLNGVGGFLFTSTRKGYEGNSLFIPLSGMNDSSKIRFEGQYGWYWSDELYYDSEHEAYVSKEGGALWLEHTGKDNHIVKSRPRSVGLPIRPIYIGEI